ncbi:MAG: hypothetical protein GY774_34660 [Planctomycetes bacterium]|nr:hypothetical protein [Planctomycetota bacterium]
MEQTQQRKDSGRSTYAGGPAPVVSDDPRMITAQSPDSPRTVSGYHLS